MEETRKTTGSPIIKVTFFEPINGRTEYYFGSLKAIYAVFTREQVGCALDALYYKKLTPNVRKVTSKCIIEKQCLTRLKNSVKREG